MKKVYLDYAATTPTYPKVAEAIRPYFTEIFGNPSSIHRFGQDARKAVESAREKVASLIGANPDEIVFTSGGTEADNFALEGVAFANEKKGNHIITSKIEHHAVTECAEFLAERGFNISYLPVDKFGIVDPEDVKKTITDKKKAYISIPMLSKQPPMSRSMRKILALIFYQFPDINFMGLKGLARFI